jgi:hypothetical protein
VSPGIAIASGCSAANASLPNAGGTASSILDDLGPAGCTQTAEKFRPRKIAVNPLDFRLGKPYICSLFRRINVFEIRDSIGKRSMRSDKSSI